MKSIVIRAIRPWSQLNEYEGELDVEVEGILLTARTVLSGADAWAGLAIGTTVEVDLWLECLEDAEVLAPPAAVVLASRGGASYEAVGRVLTVAGDNVLLATRIELRVDLNSTSVQPAPVLHAGDVIRVTGQLQIDLDPDPEGSA
jgi:hypothetical protein